MILYQLNVLTENEKTATVWSEGDFVADRQENDFSILFYQLYFLVLVGALFALVLNKDKFKVERTADTGTKAQELIKGLTIVKEEPKVLLGVLYASLIQPHSLLSLCFYRLICPVLDFQQLYGSRYGALFLPAILPSILFLVLLETTSVGVIR